MGIIKTRQEQRNKAIAEHYVNLCSEVKSSKAIEATAEAFNLSVPQIYYILRRTEL